MKFELSNQQSSKYKEWTKTHNCIFRNEQGYRNVGAVGGADTFKITPTSIGYIISVKCACGQKLDLTEDF